MSNRILSEPRKLSNNELVELEKAKSKWYPAIVQTYNTSLLDMMASPVKKSLVVLTGLVLLLVIFFFVDKHMYLNLLSSKGKVHKLNLLVALGVIIFYAGVTGYTQYKLNDNLGLFLTLTRQGATKYDYESSNVIQSKLLRSSIGRGYSSGGSGVLGGALGYGLGSRSRRR
tara:strand:+ start:1095 stop:1607 length:513 start_codon:yes stop_codon:yes gene_type:complete